MTDTRSLGVLAFEGFEELDAVGPYEVFEKAATFGADWTVELLAVEENGSDGNGGDDSRGNGRDGSHSNGGDVAADAHGESDERDRGLVTAAGGLRVESDGVLTAGSDIDYLVVPGGGWNDPTDEGVGARALAENEAVLDAIRTLHEGGATVLSVCTGAMVLERAGLLDGRPAVTHHSALDELRETEAEVVEARVVDDGDVVTAGGITAGIDMALWVVEREWGREVAYEVENAMEYERSTDVYRSGGTDTTGSGPSRNSPDQ